jgi:RNA polymerase sigma-70 factor (ECF subfamily)
VEEQSLNPALIQPRPLAHQPPLGRTLDFEAVYRMHGMTVARWAARLGGPKVDCEDVVQEVFLKVRAELPRFRDEGRMEAWLYRMTLNEVRYRRRKNRLWGWLSGSAEEAGRGIATTQKSVPEELEQRDAVTQLYAALEGMNEKYRQVLVLHEFEERSGEEIAQLMGARVETVWVWLHRARAALEKRLREQGESSP